MAQELKLNIEQNNTDVMLEAIVQSKDHSQYSFTDTKLADQALEIVAGTTGYYSQTTGFCTQLVHHSWISAHGLLFSPELGYKVHQLLQFSFFYLECIGDVSLHV